jgi:translation initiation factor 2 subunit 3
MTIDIKLSEIVNNQAIFNCGTAGHVSHGKSTLVKGLTGVTTQRYQKEKERNITIKLGYANCKLFINPVTNEIFSHPSSVTKATDPTTNDPLQLLYNISFVDCPGHQVYMATMISGSKIMDHAMVIIAANERIPQPQTHQHILALDYSRIKNISFVLNKMDLVREKDVVKIKHTLTSYLSKTGFEAPVIYPISAATGTNVDKYCRYLAGQVSARLPVMIEQSKKTLRMNIVRSYNVNKPNTSLHNLVGAVVGGSIQSGILTVGDQVELRPGVYKMKDGIKVLQPLVATVLSLESDANSLQYAIPGGLIGVNLSIYAGLGNNDRLKGQVLGHVGQLPDVYNKLIGKYYHIDVRANDTDVQPMLMQTSQICVIVNGIMNVNATIVQFKPDKKDSKKGKIALDLHTPVVLDLAEINSIAIMIDPKNGGTLIASLKVTSAELDVPIVYPEGTDHNFIPATYEIINDLPEFHCEPETFNDLSQHINYRSQVKVIKESLPIPTINTVNRSSFITGKDLDALISALTCTCATVPDKFKKIDLKEIFVQNIAREFSNSDPRFNGEGALVLNGKYRTAQFQVFISTFCKKLLACPGCNNIKTTLGKVDGSITRVCHCCPAVTYLHCTDMGKI